MKVSLRPQSKRLYDDSMFQDRFKAVKVSYNMSNSAFYTDFQSLLTYICLNFLSSMKLEGTEFQDEYEEVKSSGVCVKALKLTCYLLDRNDLYHSLLDTNFNTYANATKHDSEGQSFSKIEGSKMLLLYNDLIDAMAISGSPVTKDMLVTGKKGNSNESQNTIPAEAPLDSSRMNEIEEGIYNYYGYRVLSLLGEPFARMDEEERDYGVVSNILVSDGFNLVKASITENVLSGEVKSGLFGRRILRFSFACSHLPITKSDMSGAYMKANRLRICYITKEGKEEEIKLSYPEYHTPVEIPMDHINSSTLHFKIYIIYRGRLREKSTTVEFDLNVC